MFRLIYSNFLLLSIFLISGCSSIYVANVKFTAPEICSEELASRLHPSSGCLPPTRVSNVQRFYIERFRPQITKDEAEKLDAADAIKTSTDNVLPSLLGRAIKLDWDDQNGLVKPPKDANLDFLALGDIAGKQEPQRLLKTEVSVSTSLKGAVDTQTSYGATADPAAIVDAALGIPLDKLSPAMKVVRGSLINKVGGLSLKKHKQDSSQGTYMYVTLTASEIDSLNHLLAVCNMVVVDQKESQSSEHVAIRDRDNLHLMVAAAVEAQDRVDTCSTELANANYPAEIRALVTDIRGMHSLRPDVSTGGIIIGAAILRSEGASQVCSDFDIGLISAGKDGMISPDCKELQKAFEGAPKPAPEVDGKADDSSLSDMQKANIMLSISAQMKEKSYKSLDTHEHTSVLAFHWIPFKMR